MRKGAGEQDADAAAVADVEFAASDTVAMVISFDDLFQDWRALTRKIADRLEAPVDTHRRADEADEFLDPGLRRQQSGEGVLDFFTHDPEMKEIHAFFHAWLARCDRVEETRSLVSVKVR